MCMWRDTMVCGSLFLSKITKDITSVAMEPNNKFSLVFLLIYEIFHIAYNSVAVVTSKNHLDQRDSFYADSYHFQQHKMYLGLHIQCPTFLSNFSQTWSFLTDVISHQHQISCKTIQWEPRWCTCTQKTTLPMHLKSRLGSKIPAFKTPTTKG
jgi:hypothetical protein